MRKIIFIGIMQLACVGLTHAQAVFKKYGFNKAPLTLSNGKYNEFFTNDEVVQIGTVKLNTRTNQIIEFLEEDTTKANYKSEFSSRWLSVDPLAEKYPNYSPYVYCANNPLKYIDPDGRILFLVNGYDGASTKTKFSSNSSDFAKMKSYWTNNNPQFIQQVTTRFNEKKAYLVDGSQGGLSHGSVQVRHDAGYAYAQNLIDNGLVDFSEPINIVGHSMGGAFGAGMTDAFLKANPNAVVNLLLLAPDGAEQFSVDKRANTAQFTFSDDGVVTNNSALVGNYDANLNTSQSEYSPFQSASILKALKAHSAPIDDSNTASSILNDPILKNIFKTQTDEKK